MNSLKFHVFFFFFFCMLKCRTTDLLLLTSYKYILKDKKRSVNSLPVLFSALFLKQKISYIISFLLTKFHYLIPFTFWDIWKYLCCNCLCSSFWRHKFRNIPWLSYRTIFLQNQKSQVKNLKILRTNKAFKIK